MDRALKYLSARERREASSEPPRMGGERKRERMRRSGAPRGRGTAVIARAGGQNIVFYATLEAMAKKTVSLFLYIPEQHAIVLGVRASTQSHPHLLQATCHGAIEKGEDHADAIERELLEETTLGLPDIGPLTFLGELGAGHKVKEECSYYLAEITDAHAKKIRPTAEVGHFVFLTKDTLRDIIPFTEAEKKHCDTSVHRVMFDDELEALEEAFALLDEHRWQRVGGG